MKRSGFFKMCFGFLLTPFKGSFSETVKDNASDKQRGATKKYISDYSRFTRRLKKDLPFLK